MPARIRSAGGLPREQSWLLAVCRPTPPKETGSRSSADRGCPESLHQYRGVRSDYHNWLDSLCGLDKHAIRANLVGRAGLELGPVLLRSDRMERNDEAQRGLVIWAISEV